MEPALSDSDMAAMVEHATVMLGIDVWADLRRGADPMGSDAENGKFHMHLLLGNHPLLYGEGDTEVGAFSALADNLMGFWAATEAMPPGLRLAILTGGSYAELD